MRKGPSEAEAANTTQRRTRGNHVDLVPDGAVRVAGSRRRRRDALEPEEVTNTDVTPSAPSKTVAAVSVRGILILRPNRRDVGKHNRLSNISLKTCGSMFTAVSKISILFFFLS